MFLAGQGLDWREVRLEDVAGFVAWLRRPPAARDWTVAVLPSVEHHCGESTVNRKLSALSAFYQHAARNGVDLGELLVTWQPAGRRGTAWKPFLHHITKGQPQARRTVALKAPRKLPRVLTVAEMQAILDACDRLRDQFLFALLYEACGSARRSASTAATSTSTTRWSPSWPANSANHARSRCTPLPSTRSPATRDAATSSAPGRAQRVSSSPQPEPRSSTTASTQCSSDWSATPCAVPELAHQL